MSKKIQIEATIRAPITNVWIYWTEPNHITKWNFAIPEWHCPSAQNELMVGGKFSARMEAKDGSMGFDFEGIYDEVIPYKTLSYTMADGRRVTTHFKSVEDSTYVTTLFDPEQENPEDLQKNGWQSILNNFKKYAESK